MGHLLLILLINDIVDASNTAEFIVLADDTNQFLKHKELGVLYITTSIELA